jgi:SAM-dependent methyltransferase
VIARRWERLKGSTTKPVRLDERHLAHLLTRFPELEALALGSGLSTTEASRAIDAVELAVVAIHEPAREVQRRNAIVDLLALVPDERARRRLQLDLADSNFRSGVIDRTAQTYDLLGVTPPDELVEAVAEFERRYDSRAGLIPHLRSWSSLSGDPRGLCVVASLEQLTAELRDRAIVHVAAESAARKWFDARRDELGVEYRTLDAAYADADLKEDLTSLTLPSDSADVVICHRVLEHVLDDRSALREIRRILRPGGLLHVSVPMAVQMDETNEWVIRDRSHDLHVRHYGLDFEQRLRDAGFEVGLDRTLLDRTLEEHLLAGTFPLRIYLATAPG